MPMNEVQGYLAALSDYKIELSDSYIEYSAPTSDDGGGYTMTNAC